MNKLYSVQMRNIVFLALPLLLLHNITFSQITKTLQLNPSNLQKVLSTDSLWRYTTLDSASFAGLTYNDSAWRVAPSTQHLQSLPNWSGKGWFRLPIEIDSTLFNTTISLELAYYSAAEVYLDGALVHTFGRVGASAKEEREERAAFAPFPLHFSATNHHVLAIRTSTFLYTHLQNTYSPHLLDWLNSGFNVSFHDYSEHLDFTLKRRSSRLVITMIPLGILLFLALLHGVMYAFTARERMNLYLAFFSADMAMLCFSLAYRFISSSGREALIWNEMAATLEIGLAGLSLGAAIDWITRQKISIFWWRVTLPGTLLLMVSRFFVPSLTWNLFLLIALGAEVTRISIEIVRAIQQRQAGTSVIGIGMLVFFIASAAMTILTAYQPDADFLVFALLNYLLFLSMPVALAFFMAGRFERINTELAEQLEYTKALSDRTIEQEQEKQRLMERQKEELERVVEERTQQLQETNHLLKEQKKAVQQANMQLLRKNVNITAEQEKSEELLLSILPEAIAKRLKNGELTIADKHEEVTVLFADIAGFTRFASKIDPQNLVALLDTVFSEFDNLVEKHGVEKIKTIGDAYMVVGGLQAHSVPHTETLARLALDMQDAICRLSEEIGLIGLTVRIGIHRGAVVAGVIGKKKPSYDLWGDTVNIASRMESHGEAGKIQVSEEVFTNLVEQFHFRERGDIRIKGKGTMRTYFLEQERR
jgi:adenylate cyclase